MNIVCFLGNGLDISLGLKTSYNDFYEYYLAQSESTKPSVQKLREEIRSDFGNWADLELALGAHCKHLNDAEDVYDVFFDISERLAEYLQEQEETCDYTSKNSERFFSDALSPEGYLTPQERTEFSKYSRKIRPRSHQNHVSKLDIITFNYTRSMERILGDDKEIEQAIKSVGLKYRFGKLEHVHGKLGDTPVLGLNDESQIKNDELTLSEDAMEVCIKPKHSNAIGQMVDSRCAQIVRTADLIILFGLSIGETDKIWWERIGQRLQEGCLLFIFVYSKEFDVPTSQIVKHNRFKRNIKEQFLAKTEVGEAMVDFVMSRIFVGINRPVFAL